MTVRKIQTVFCGLIFITLAIIYGLKLYTAISFPYLQEYREMTMIVFADKFSKGINLYSLAALTSEIPTITSVYGFLAALLASPFVFIFGKLGVSTLIVCRVFIILLEIAGITLAAKSVKILTSSDLSSCATALLISGCYWRYAPFGGAYPDQLGIFMNFLLMYLVLHDTLRIETTKSYKGALSISNTNVAVKPAKYHVFIYALILVLNFYIKQYFVFSVVGLLIFMFLHSKKDLIKLITFGALLTAVSLVISTVFFPLYLSEALPISQGSTASYGFAWSIGQIPYIIMHYYLIPVAMLFLAVIYILIKDGISIIKDVLSSYVFLQLAGSFPLVLVIARNNGTYMTYWFQMWIPYIIIASIVAINYAFKITATGHTITDMRYVGGKTQNVPMLTVIIALTIVTMLFTYQSRSLLFQKPHSASDYSAWQEAYDFMDQYGTDGKILADAHMSLYLYNKGIETSEYGQCEYSGQESYDNVINHPLWSKFPYAIRMLENNIAHEQKVREQLKNHEYSCVVLGNIYRYYLTDEEMKSYGYENIKNIDIQIGIMNIETSCWVPAKTN